MLGCCLEPIVNFEIRGIIQMRETARSIIKVIIVSLICGALLTCASIVVVGKKTYFSHCDYSGKRLNAVNRGAPFTYFKASPSVSTCVAVENVGAVFASDVGNDVSFKHLFADWFIWSGVSAVVILAIRKIKGSRNSASPNPTESIK